MIECPCESDKNERTQLRILPLISVEEAVITVAVGVSTLNGSGLLTLDITVKMHSYT